MHANRRKTQRGAALIMALCFTMVVLAVGIAMLSLSTNELTATKSQGDTVTMRNLAETGVERAMARVNAEPTWRCADPANPSNSDPAYSNVPVTAKVNGADQTLGTFTVDKVEDLGGDYIRVTARGYYPNATAANKQAKQVRLTAYKRWGTPFSAAAFGKSGVPLANGETDSYNSDNGAYGGSNIGNKGDIRTDSTAPGSIEIKNNGQCNGKVIYGPGTDLSQVTLNRSRINDGDANEGNDILVAPHTAVMPDAVIPAGAIELRTVSGFSNNTLSGGSLQAGTYWCDSIAISGNSQVYITGKVTIYVKGKISIGGNGMLNNGVPANLQIYGLPTCTSVDISGNGNLSAAVYAPQADIVLNGAGSNGKVFGALAGKTVSFNGNGTVLHYDEALQNVKGTVIGFRTKTWTEDF